MIPVGLKEHCPGNHSCWDMFSNTLHALWHTAIIQVPAWWHHNDPLQCGLSFTSMTSKHSKSTFLCLNLWTLKPALALPYMSCNDLELPPPGPPHQNTDNCHKHRKPTGQGNCYRVMGVWAQGGLSSISWKWWLGNCCEAFTLRRLADWRPTTANTGQQLPARPASG